jgi:hypothetical protein
LEALRANALMREKNVFISPPVGNYTTGAEEACVVSSFVLTTLCQDTTLVVPLAGAKEDGFRSCLNICLQGLKPYRAGGVCGTTEVVP